MIYMMHYVYNGYNSYSCRHYGYCSFCHDRSRVTALLYLLQAAWATHIELSRNKVRRNDMDILGPKLKRLAWLLP